MRSPHHLSRLKPVPLPLSYLLFHHNIHRTQIPLRILELLNHPMLTLLIYLSHNLPIRLLKFLQTQPDFSYKEDRLSKRSIHTSTCSSMLLAYKYTNTPALVFRILVSSLFMIPPISFSPG